MANIDHITKNIYAASADQIEGSSRNTTLIIGGIIAFLLLLGTFVQKVHKIGFTNEPLSDQVNLLF